jgi:hypothetical protein
MKYRLYHITFESTSDELSHYYECLPIYEQDKLQGLDVLASFDHDIKPNGYNCYFLTTEDEIKIYEKILNDNLIDYICSDISESVIYNKIYLEEDLMYHINEENTISYVIFIDEVNDWIYENLDLDIILDIISDKGISNIRTIDKKYLDNLK